VSARTIAAAAPFGAAASSKGLGNLRRRGRSHPADGGHHPTAVQRTRCQPLRGYAAWHRRVALGPSFRRSAASPPPRSARDHSYYIFPGGEWAAVFQGGASIRNGSHWRAGRNPYRVGRATSAPKLGQKKTAFYWGCVDQKMASLSDNFMIVMDVASPCNAGF
jgi:hypothetical protein